MSFSGRRVSILPASNRRFSTGKDLSLNGTWHLSSFIFFGKTILTHFHTQNSAPKPIVNSETPTKATNLTPVSIPPVPPPVSSGVQNAPLNMATPKTLLPGQT